jgi:Type II secretion system (T2SS), protein E, N-terminal domain
VKQGRVVDLLVQDGLLDQHGLDQALQIQVRDGGSLGRIVAGLGLAAEDEVNRALAKGLGLTYVDLGAQSPPAESDLCLPPQFCRDRLVLPLGVQDHSLRLAMANPFDQATVQDVEFRTSKWVTAVVASETALLKMLRGLYPELDEPAVAFDCAPIRSRAIWPSSC